MAMATKLYQLFNQVANVVHIIPLEDVMAYDFSLALTLHIVRRATQ